MVNKLQTNCNNFEHFLLPIFIYVSAKKPDEKKGKEDEQTLTEVSSTHRRSQAKYLLVQTGYIIMSVVGLYGRILISVKILPHRPPARLIRAK